MHHLLNSYPVWTWSLFFGLITGSILILARSLENLKQGLTGLLFGTLIAYWVTGMIPVETPQTLWFLFLSGLVAICAMILPGLSGAFILLILGKYAYITSVLRDPFSMDHLQIILVFVLGCLTGILAFSRVLRFALTKFPQTTLGLLTGFMIGALRKVWPWKIPLETEIIRGKEYVLQEINIMPETNLHLFIAILLMIFGFSLVLWLGSHQGKSRNQEI
jgi:putative membrane protein